MMSSSSFNHMASGGGERGERFEHEQKRKEEGISEQRVQPAITLPHLHLRPILLLQPSCEIDFAFAALLPAALSGRESVKPADSPLNHECVHLCMRGLIIRWKTVK
jgi:hypothetical protein